MRQPLAVITDNRFGDADIERSILEPAGVTLVVADCKSAFDVASAAKEADAILVNLAPVDTAVLENLVRCRVISRYGVGLDNIDVKEARRRGIEVLNVRGYCDREVAEHALALIFSIARRIAERDAAIRKGSWNVPFTGRRIAGTRLGVLGFGAIGRAFVRASLSVGFSEILVWSRSLTRERLEAALGMAPGVLGVVVRPVDFEELVTSSDWVSIHLPVTPETRGLFNSSTLGCIKRGAVLVNVSRGAIIEEQALIRALRAGHLGGAGLDVFEVEPLPLMSDLRSMPAVVLTDHSAYSSRESVLELRRRTSENALVVLRHTGVIIS